MSKTQYYSDIQTGNFHIDIWDYLKTDGWKNIYPKNFEYNNLIGVLKRKEAKPVVGNFIPIYKGMKWLSDQKKVIART